jgi:hypothetical protein
LIFHVLVPLIRRLFPVSQILRDIFSDFEPIGSMPSSG